MRQLSEIYQELFSHPEFITVIETWDKQDVLDELYNQIFEVNGWEEASEEYVESLCEKWYNENVDDMKKDFKKYFTMGEYHHYLDIDIEEWLEQYLVESEN